MSSNFSRGEREGFQLVALAHCAAALDPREIETIREHAARSPSSLAGEVFNAGDGPLQLTQKIFESGFSLADLEPHRGRMCAAGELEGGPVIYVQGAGIFIYSPPDRSSSLMIWLSHPAYPKGW